MVLHIGIIAIIIMNIRHCIKSVVLIRKKVQLSETPPPPLPQQKELVR